jgi:formylglycine-generating enzyme required for sulfatase activity
MYDSPETPVETGSRATPHLKVMRGGGWMHQSAWLRSAYRYERSPNSRNMDHGFRCAFDRTEGDQ